MFGRGAAILAILLAMALAPGFAQANAQHDAGLLTDAPASSAPANLTAGTYHGELYYESQDMEDWYRIAAPDGEPISVSFTARGTGAFAVEHTDQGNLTSSQWSDGNTVTFPPMSGPISLGFGNTAGVGIATYTFTVSFGGTPPSASSAPPDDAATDGPGPRALHAQHYMAFPVDASSDPQTLWVFWNASAPIDAVVLDAAQFSDYENGTMDRFPDALPLRALDAAHGEARVLVPAGASYAVVWDNADTPEGGADGQQDVHLTLNAFVTPATLVTPMGLARTAAFQQDAWMLPGLPGMGVSGQAILFLALAIACEVAAWRGDKRRWIDLTVMVALAAAFSAFVATQGVILPDTRLLTVPGMILGFFAMRRSGSRLVAAAGVFAACFWGPFLGGDVLSLAIHHAAIAQGWADEGAVMVIGGAGWQDALVLVPVFGLLSFLGRGGLLGALVRRRKARRAAAAAPAAPPAEPPGGGP